MREVRGGAPHLQLVQQEGQRHTTIMQAAIRGKSLALTVAAAVIMSVLHCAHAPCSDGDSMTATECLFFQSLGLCETLARLDHHLCAASHVAVARCK